MTAQKAPAYEDVASHLDKMFTSTFTFPSVRDLKAKCGGAGSLSTYQAYKERWLEDRIGASGVQSILMAMRVERNTHDSVMDALNSRLARLLQIFPSADRCSEDDDLDHRAAEREPDRRGDQEDVEEDNTTTSSDSFTDRDERGTDRAADIAAQSIARFVEDDPIPSANEAEGREPRSFTFEHEAARPTDQIIPSKEDSAPSRFIGGGPQVAHPTEATQPGTGEGDTNGGSTNGYA